MLATQIYYFITISGANAICHKDSSNYHQTRASIEPPYVAESLGPSKETRLFALTSTLQFNNL